MDAEQRVQPTTPEAYRGTRGQPVATKVLLARLGSPAQLSPGEPPT
jgi:hypothetical protein